MQSLQKSHQSNKKKIILAVTAALIVVSGVILYLYLNTELFGSSTNTDSNQVKSPENPLTEDELGITPAKSDDPTSNSAKTNETPPDSVADDLLEITSTSVNGDEFVIRTLLTKITAKGQCTLSMQRGAQTYTATAGVQPTATSSTCKGFDVPVSELSSGKWTVTVSYTDGTDTLKASEVADIDA